METLTSNSRNHQAAERHLPGQDRRHRLRAGDKSGSAHRSLLPRCPTSIASGVSRTGPSMGDLAAPTRRFDRIDKQSHRPCEKAGTDRAASNRGAVRDPDQPAAFQLETSCRDRLLRQIDAPIPKIGDVCGPFGAARFANETFHERPIRQFNRADPQRCRNTRHEMPEGGLRK